MLFFQIAHCGADAITSENPFWTITGIEQNYTGIVRSQMNIPISKDWDNVYITCCLQILHSGTRTYKFINHTGTATNASYNSSFSVIALRLK